MPATIVHHAPNSPVSSYTYIANLCSICWRKISVREYECTQYNRWTCLVRVLQHHYNCTQWNECDFLLAINSRLPPLVVNNYNYIIMVLRAVATHDVFAHVCRCYIWLKNIMWNIAAVTNTFARRFSIRTSAKFSFYHNII